MKYIYCSLYQSKNLIFTQNSKYYRDQCHASIHKLKHTDITCIDRSIHSFLGFYFSPNFCTRTAKTCKIYKDKWTRLHVSIILAKGKRRMIIENSVYKSACICIANLLCKLWLIRGSISCRIDNASIYTWKKKQHTIQYYYFRLGSCPI